MAVTDVPRHETHGELDAEELEEIWADAPGVPGFFSTVDHKRIGMRYIYTAFFFFFVSGLMALVMRSQLAAPNNHVVGPETYNQLMTIHGTTMIFLFNTPVLAGFGNYILPLQLGTRDMAFPRLNAFSYWIFVLSGIFFFASFLIGKAPDGGWFGYVPLTDKAFSPGINLDFWGLAIVFVGISTTVGAINFIVTTFKMRAPGMTINRVPLFVWSILSMAFMVLFAVPAVTLAAGLLELDRLFGTAFFAPHLGGNTLLYQHLFWFWGHPEVYILFVPATGMISMIIPVAARRPIAGYLWVATALIAIAFISFGVWVHHMFATGMPVQAMSFFSAVSLIIVLPSGVQFFAWIATMWKGRVQFTTPMMFGIGFLLIFLLGGITRAMLAVLPFNWQVTDSYFIVAHFHYVLNAAVVFPIIGAIYFSYSEMSVHSLSERGGQIRFCLRFVGFNVAFFGMHILGFLGMPRRIATYPSGLGWDGLNLISTMGGFIFAVGTGITLVNWFHARCWGKPAGPDPWEADTLEWATTSPPPEYNFASIPVVASRHPLWDQRPLPTADPDGDDATKSLGPQGAEHHETPETTGLDARPTATLDLPHPTYLPFILALGIGVVFVGLMIQAVLVGVIGAAAGVVGMTWWLWRTEVDLA